MNKTFNNNIRNAERYQRAEKIDYFEFFMFMISAVYSFITNEAVVLITKLVIGFASVAVIFLMMCLNASGTLPFVTSALVTIVMFVIAIMTFKSINLN